MAITTHTTPSPYMPAYNPHWWVASSTQTAQPNFSYYIVVTDLITGETITETPPARPDNKVIFNSATFAEKFIDQVNPSGLYGFQKNTNAIRKIRVNIGERYDVAGTSTIFTGTNQDYIVWNAVLNLEEEEGYSVGSYLYSQVVSGIDPTPNLQYLTNNRSDGFTWFNGVVYCNDENTYEGKSNYLYCLSSAAGDFEKIQIDLYNSANALIQTTIVTNPYNTGTTYTDKLVFIDVGYNGLVNMPSGQITSGTTPNVAAAHYYTISDASSFLILPALIKRIYVRCEPRFDVIATHHLGKHGQFESFCFSKMSERTSEVQKTSYSKYPYELDASNFVLATYGKAVEKILSVSEKNKLSVASDYLTTEEIARLKELSTSPLVYVDDGDPRGYMAMKMNTSTYKEFQKYNEPLTSLRFDLERTYTNHRQRG